MKILLWLWDNSVMKISTKRIKIIQLYTILSYASKNRLDISQWIFSNVQQSQTYFIFLK